MAAYRRVWKAVLYFWTYHVDVNAKGKTQRVVITFLRVVYIIQSQRIFYYALIHWPINGLLIYNALAESMWLRVA